MKTMNLFGTQEKPKRKTYSEDFKKEAVELADEIGNTNAAKELGVSPSSISNWKKAFSSAPSNPAPIQDSEGNLTFTLNGNTYTLNVNSEEERNSILAQVNSVSEYRWYWFKEMTGKKHWVLYNTEMYEVLGSEYLHYRENSNLAPILPINATSCYYMFYECIFLTSLDVTNFDTSQVIDMSYMFYDCRSLTTLDITNFNTSKVISMRSMFSFCSKLTSLDVTNFNTSIVTTMNYMFFGCSSLTTLDVTNFDTSNVTNMSSMFYYCSGLTSLDVTNFDTSNVISMAGMFANCMRLTSLDVTNFDTSKVTDMDCMFCECRRFTHMDVTSFDISKVEHIDLIFFDCTSLKTVKTTDPELFKHIRENYPQIRVV